MNKYLRSIISGISGRYASDDKELELIVSAVTYSYCLNAVSSNISNSASLRQTAEAYMPKVYEGVSALKGKMVSYDLMKNAVNETHKTNFDLFSDTDIKNVMAAYANTAEITPFSVNSFSVSTFRLSDISSSDVRRLRKAYDNALRPITLYYISKKGIAESSMEISSAIDEHGLIGKEIRFRINGISPSIIMKDFQRNAFKTDIYSMSIDGLNVRIIMR